MSSKVSDFFAYADALKGLDRLAENAEHAVRLNRKKLFYELLQQAGDEFMWSIGEAIEFRNDASFHFTERKYMTAIICFSRTGHDGSWCNTLHDDEIFNGPETDYEGFILAIEAELNSTSVFATHNDLLEDMHEALKSLKAKGYEKQTEKLLLQSWGLICYFWETHPELLASNRKQFAPYYY